MVRRRTPQPVPVGGGTGALQVPSGATVTSTLNAVSSTATDLRVTLSQDTAQNNTVYSTVSDG